MTANKEDYLNIIYKMGGMERLISNKEISDKLQIAPASVSEMLAKLQKDGLIAYTPYKGSQLTKKGLAACIKVVRSHRLWEVFLIRHLGYSWSEAHEDAHLLEHVAPKRLVNRLDRFLNYPEYCPHGSLIPDEDGSITPVSLITMDRLQPGDCSHIRRFTEEKELLDYLQGLGIEIGDAFMVSAAAPYEGPLDLDVNGKVIQVSYKAACRIYVDIV